MKFIATTLAFALILTIAVASQPYTARGQSENSSTVRKPEAGQTNAATQTGNGQLDKRKRESSAEKLFREARKASQKGHYRDAATMYMSLVGKDSADLEARQNAAYAFFKDQDFQKCYDQASEVLKVNPNSARSEERRVGKECRL